MEDKKLTKQQENWKMKYFCFEIQQSWSTYDFHTRVDQSKYSQFEQMMITKLQQLLSDEQLDDRFGILVNQVPQEIFDVHQETGLDRTLVMDVDPRLWSFEVQIQGVLLFSKLQSGLWPNCTKVAEKCIRVAQDLWEGKNISGYVTKVRPQSSLNTTNDFHQSFSQSPQKGQQQEENPYKEVKYQPRRKNNFVLDASHSQSSLNVKGNRSDQGYLMDGLSERTKDLRGFEKEQAEMKFSIIKDCIKQRYDFIYNDEQGKVEPFYHCYLHDYTQFAGMHLQLQGEDKGWNQEFWLPQIEESSDPREILRYHKLDYELYQKLFLGLIYELIDRQKISYLHHEMAGQICMDIESEEHHAHREQIKQVQEGLHKEIADITARLEAEEAERERLAAEEKQRQKEEQEEKARQEKLEKERQEKLEQERLEEEERLRLLKLKDQPSEDQFKQKAAQLEDEVWAEFDPDENGKIDPINFFTLYRKMIKEKKRKPDQAFMEYLQREMQNDQTTFIMKEDFIDYFVPIRAKKLAEDFEADYQNKLAMGFFTKEAVEAREKAAEAERQRKEEERLKKEAEDAEEEEESNKKK